MSEQKNETIPTTMTNEQIRESGCMEDIVRAMEHDATGLAPEEIIEVIEDGTVSTYQIIEKNVVGAYQAIEDAVVGGYKKIEDGAVSGFNKISDKFVEVFFAKEGETVEDAKARLRGEE